MPPDTPSRVKFSGRAGSPSLLPAGSSGRMTRSIAAATGLRWPGKLRGLPIPVRGRFPATGGAAKWGVSLDQALQWPLLLSRDGIDEHLHQCGDGLPCDLAAGGREGDGAQNDSRSPAKTLPRAPGFAAAYGRCRLPARGKVARPCFSAEREVSKARM